MNQKLLGILLSALVSTSLPALAEQFAVGDSVIVLPGWGNYSGVVTQLGGPSGMVRVRLSTSPPDSPGSWYNPNNMKHGGGGGAGGNAGGGGGGGGGGVPGGGGTPGGGGIPGGGGGGGQFHVGDNVIVLGTYQGTVTEVGGPSGQVRVQLNTSPAGSPGAWFNPANMKLGGGGSHGGVGAGNNGAGGGGGGGGAGGGGGGAGGGGGGQAPANPGQNGFRDAFVVPKGSPPNEDTFKKIIMSNQVPQGSSTVYVDFPVFQNEGHGIFNNADAGNLQQHTAHVGGPEQNYDGYKYHVKFVKRERFDSPNSPDEVTTFEGDYVFFKDKNGEWFGKSDNMQMIGHVEHQNKQ